MNGTFGGEYKHTFARALTKNIIIIIICIAISFVNAVLIHTFHKNEILSSKPRYILFIHMVINDTLLLILSVLLLTVNYVVHVTPVSLCTIFILILICTTENTPLNLACMALECYVAICYPLHHTKVCTVRRTRAVIGFIWLVTVLSAMTDLFVTLATSQTGFFHSKIICTRSHVFPSPIVAQKRNYLFIVLLLIVWLVIFYTYLKILFSAKTVSNDIKKARNTIILHGVQVLMCMGIYITPALRDMLIRLFPRSAPDIQYAVYVTVQILPRSLSPIVYGIKDTTFRKNMKVYLKCEVGHKVEHF